ncbi:MAG: matrixin family metalloprotease [Phycisphaerales bacterium]|nr:matrixin family metalloprotease [Phycisphaerales bacterium]
MKMAHIYRFALIAPFGLLWGIAGCPSAGPEDAAEDADQTTSRAIPRGSVCGQIAVGCFDELARLSADSIRFRPISRWARTTLTWRFANFHPDIGIEGQIDAATRAFSKWSDASALAFKRVQEDSDITITFEADDHGDSFAFDGAGGNLGHAFFPSSERAGEIHLDFAEEWALTPGAGLRDLFTVLLHDIGHALGLDHSLDAQAVMAPDYPAAGLTDLTQDDVREIQYFYGSADGTVLPFDPMLEPRPQPPDLTGLGDPDTDGDGIPDTLETFLYGTDYLKPDTDGDGVGDYTELFVDGTLPTGRGLDSDGDGLPNALEADLGTDPNGTDTDGDGVSDSVEHFSGTNPGDPDTDGDGCDDLEDSFPGNSSQRGIDCVECASDADCDDGNLCTRDFCAVAAGVCTTVPTVCAADQTCNGLTGTCETSCVVDADCNDGLFCNGVESCFDARCLPGATACAAGETCAEASHECTASSPTVFFDDFEGGIGNWFADNGIWEVGVPSSGPNSAHSPENVAATVLAGNYPDGTSSRLVSPSIQLPAILAGEELHLRFWHWFLFPVACSSDCGTDSGVVQIRVQTALGQWEPWTDLHTFYNSSAVYTNVLVDLSSYAGKKVQVGFLLSPGSLGSPGPGWYIDDVTIDVF